MEKTGHGRSRALHAVLKGLERTVFLGVAVTVIFFAGTFRSRHAASSSRSVAGEKRRQEQRDRAEIRRKVRAAFEAYSRQNGLAFRQFLDAVQHQTCMSDKAIARAGDALIRELCSLRGVKNIAGKAVYDKFKHRRTLERYLQERTHAVVTVPLIKPEVIRLHNLLEGLDASLRENSVELQQNLVTLSRTCPGGADLDFQRIEQQLDDLERRTAGILSRPAAQQGFMKVSIAAGLATSETMFKVVYMRAVAPILKRFFAKSAMVAALPAADGPLPVGDAIFATAEAGFLAWDGHALYKAIQRIRKQARDRVLAELRETREELKNQTLETAKRMIEMRARETRRIREKIGKRIS